MKKNIVLLTSDDKQEEFIKWCSNKVDELAKHNIFTVNSLKDIIENVETLDDDLLDDCLYQFITPLKGKVTGVSFNTIIDMIREGKVDAFISFNNDELK